MVIRFQNFHKLIAALCLLVFSTQALAQNGLPTVTLYAAPEKQGSGNGTTPDNAMTIERLEKALVRRDRNVRVLLLSGIYNLDKPLKIHQTRKGRIIELTSHRGEVVFKGQHDLKNKKTYFAGIEFQGSGLRLSEIGFEEIGACIRIVGRGASDVTLQGLKAKNVYDCIMVDRNKAYEVQNWTINGLTVDGFERSAIRLSGPRLTDVTIRNIDLNGDHDGVVRKCHRAGIQIFKGAKNITVDGGRIANVIGSCGEDKYKQGDGIEVDNKGGAPENITFKNLEISNTSDGAFDLKGKNVRLENIKAYGGPISKFGFRFWMYNSYECNNCFSANAQRSHLWMRSSKVAMKNAVFQEPAQRACIFVRDKKTKQHESELVFLNKPLKRGDIHLKHCLKETYETKAQEK
jgi:hypothetical protein